MRFTLRLKIVDFNGRVYVDSDVTGIFRSKFVSDEFEDEIAVYRAGFKGGIRLTPEIAEALASDGFMDLANVTLSIAIEGVNRRGKTTNVGGRDVYSVITRASSMEVRNGCLEIEHLLITVEDPAFQYIHKQFWKLVSVNVIERAVLAARMRRGVHAMLENVRRGMALADTGIPMSVVSGVIAKLI